MYDFWFTLGAAAIYHPDLVHNQINPYAAFDFVPRRVIEFSNGDFQIRFGPSTGLLRRDAATTVRLKIAAYLQSKFGVNAPPVGIYTAGRFSQLVKIPKFDSKDPKSTFDSIMANANTAYAVAIGGGVTKSPKFPAALGMSLVDGQVAGPIQNYAALPPADQATIAEILGEFQIAIPSADFTILQAFVTNASFTLATQLLMVGDQNPWADQGNTPEQMTFWPPDTTLKGEHAVA
jgi:hypothetical protein